MDKQEAVKFIHQELEQNRSQSEIVALLSKELGAPDDVVAKFVATIASQYQAAENTTAPGYSPGPQTGSELVQPSQHSAPRKPVPTPPTTAPADRAAQTEDSGQSAIEAMILDGLKKNRRQSDIVMMVCEQTGASWDQAQRLVGRVTVQNHKRLVSRQNMIIIPLTLCAILAGLALISAGVDEGLKAATDAANGIGFEDISRLEYILRYGIWGLGLGFTLLVGGTYGLIRAIQAQTA